MCLAQGPQRSDACEARTRGPSVSSQALYHWATALPVKLIILDTGFRCCLKIIIFSSGAHFVQQSENIFAFSVERNIHVSLF